MAKTPNPKDAPADFDALLDAPVTEVPATPADPDSENEVNDFETLVSTPAPEPEMTPAQKRLAVARARKAEQEALAAAAAASEADEYEGLTPDEIAELKALEGEDDAAVVAALDAEPVYTQPSAEEGTLIHVVTDGFNQFGQVWFRGQEIILSPKDYERTKDRNGVSWVDTLLHDPHAQYAKWGEIYVAPGPFSPRPGEVFADPLVTEDERRRRGVPAIVRD